MIKKITNIFYLLLFLILIATISTFYFSDKNIIIINKSRATLSKDVIKDYYNLPLLKNDTSDIIEYSDDIENYKKKKIKRKFWDLIKNI